jgi:tungstate transport system substrate-binding protein
MAKPHLWRDVLVFALVIMLAACGAAGPSAEPTATTPPPAEETDANATPADTPAASPSGETHVLRLATTTSTADSGLLDAILPDFEQQNNAQVDVIAVGTGQALTLGENCDADVLLVHARQLEDEFVANGFGAYRRDVIYNDFVIVGPADDPAAIQGMALAAEALETIATNESIFMSRGDDSGTHTKEQALWQEAGIEPGPAMEWYKSLGQGMGATLIAANEQLAYTLTDRGTFLAMRDSLPDLTVVVGGQSIEDNQDPTLRNPYGVIPVSADHCPSVQAAVAEEFIAWLTSSETQQKIGEFGRDTYGQPLFFSGTSPAT